MKDIELWQDDCLELMYDIPDKSIDAIIADPPFAQTARNSWDIVIPFNDYITLEVRKNQKYFIETIFFCVAISKEKLIIRTHLHTLKKINLQDCGLNIKELSKIMVQLFHQTVEFNSALEFKISSQQNFDSLDSKKQK